jgi:hypothetical protein
VTWLLRSRIAELHRRVSLFPAARHKCNHRTEHGHDRNLSGVHDFTSNSLFNEGMVHPLCSARQQRRKVAAAISGTRCRFATLDAPIGDGQKTCANKGKPCGGAAVTTELWITL